MSQSTIEEALLPFFINGVRYHSKNQFVTGEGAKRIADIPLETELYQASQDPWEDQLINNNDTVDLAREGIEQLFTRTELPYTFNDNPYTSHKQYVSGRYLRRQHNVPEKERLFLVIKGPWEDEPIMDNDLVNLALPGTEQIVSRKQDVKVILEVNLVEKEWQKETISFKEVVLLAYGSYDESPNKVYTVEYKRGPVQNPKGSMSKGQTVRVKNKMIFNVTETTQS